MFKNIMVPTTGSDESKRSCNLAMNLAEKLGSEITAIYVIDETLENPLNILEAEGKAIIKEVQDEGEKRGIKVNEHLIYGKPIDDMETILRKAGGDLVIITANDKSNIEKLFFGSVTETILKDSKVPVLLLK